MDTPSDGTNTTSAGSGTNTPSTSQNPAEKSPKSVHPDEVNTVQASTTNTTSGGGTKARNSSTNTTPGGGTKGRTSSTSMTSGVEEKIHTPPKKMFKKCKSATFSVDGTLYTIGEFNKGSLFKK